MTDQPFTQERSVLRAAAQYKWLVIGLTIFIAVAALGASRALPANNVARASILLEDPTQQVVLSDARVASERIIQNQLEVFRSTAVAERAIHLAADKGTEISLSRLLADVDVVNVPDTDMISVSFSAESEQDALNITTAMLDAYVEVRAEQSSRESERILERLDSAEEALRNDLATIQSEIDTLQSDFSFDDQINQLLTELATIESRLSESNIGSEQRGILLERQVEIDQRLRTLQFADQIDAGNPAITELNSRRDAIFGRLEVLDLERNDLEIRTQAAGTGISFVDEAQITSTSAGAGTLFTLSIGAFLGLLLSLGWAYSLSQRRTTFEDRRQPEAMFALPLLGDIPRFGRHITGSALPVRDDPRSPVSEAFRFAANGIELGLARRGGKGVVFLSNLSGQGKTLLIANTALAASRPDKKVLVVDADFGNQELTSTLLGDANGMGLTEVASGEALLREVVRELRIDGFGTVDVLQRGQLGDTAPEFFERESVKKVFRDLMHRYDLVLVDAPPLMQVAYTSTIANLVENAVVVIRKGADLKSAEDLLRRTRFIDVNVIGYLYNSGVSENTRPVMGSLRNVLGDRTPRPGDGR